MTDMIVYRIWINIQDNREDPLHKWLVIYNTSLQIFQRLRS
jgi:hypothetical protein